MGYAIVEFDKLRVSDLTTDKALELKAKGKEKVAGSIFIAYSYETADYKKKNAEARKERELEEAALLAEHSKSASERPSFSKAQTVGCFSHFFCCHSFSR